MCVRFSEISRIQSGGKPPGREARFVDIYHEKPIRLSVRVVVPVKEHPKFNFVGKLLGPKGNSMKRLQEDTMTKMAVLGKGSMRSRQQVIEVPPPVVVVGALGDILYPGVRYEKPTTKRRNSTLPTAQKGCLFQTSHNTPFLQSCQRI